MSVREIVSKISLSGGQGFVHNNFKSEVMKSNNQKQQKHNIQHA
jgi:hypothetical protein